MQSTPTPGGLEVLTSAAHCACASSTIKFDFAYAYAAVLYGHDCMLFMPYHMEPVHLRAFRADGVRETDTCTSRFVAIWFSNHGGSLRHRGHMSLSPVHVLLLLGRCGDSLWHSRVRKRSAQGSNDHVHPLEEELCATFVHLFFACICDLPWTS